MSHLNGDQIGRLQRAILDAFSRDEIQQLALVHLDRDFSHGAPNATFAAAVLDFIQQADREGKTPDLLRAVAAGRPLRKDLQLLVANLLSAVEASDALGESGAGRDASSPSAGESATGEAQDRGSVRQEVSVSGQAKTGDIIQIGKASGKVDLRKLLRRR